MLCMLVLRGLRRLIPVVTDRGPVADSDLPLRAISQVFNFLMRGISAFH